MLLVTISTAFATDLNCNGYEAVDEIAVNPLDPACATHIDPQTGAPYLTADAYYDYISFGCALFIGHRRDEDGDGYSAGSFDAAGLSVTLSCDNCPTVYNPDQIDADWDGIGSSCDTFSADRNCNSIADPDELSVDLSDPVCASNIDPETGAPYLTADAYYDYISFGCDVPVTGLDEDGDGFGYGTLDLGSISASLTCDNCPTVYNVDQYDLDWDGVGEVCDLPPTLEIQPSAAGLPSLFSLSGGSPNTHVVIAMSNAPGDRGIGECPGLHSGLATPRKFLSFELDLDGSAAIEGILPAQSAGQTRYFQAIDLDSCQVSNIVEASF